MATKSELKQAHVAREAAANRAPEAAYDEGPYFVQDVNEQGQGSFMLLKNYPFQLEHLMSSSEYNSLVKGLNESCGALATTWGVSLQRTVAGGMLAALFCLTASLPRPNLGTSDIGAPIKAYEKRLASLSISAHR